MKRLFLKLTLSLAILLVASQFYAQEAMGARIDSLCREVFTEWNLPGMSVIVIKDGKEVLHKGYGKTAYDQTGTDITPETQFVIASTSKAMTAALLAIIMDKENIKWNDTVKNHLSDFKLYDPWVTENFLIRDIMVHKTGFRTYATDKLPHFGYDRDEIYTLLRHIQPSYSFRTTYAYNNAMYTVAAKIVEKYTGLKWEDAIEKYLFQPLEMNSSTTGNKVWFNSPSLAKGYRNYRDGDSLKFEVREDLERGYTWLSAVAPAGFVVTTTKDIGNWIKMNLNNGSFNGNQIISEQNHRYLFAPQTITGSDTNAIYNYAQGWTIEQSSTGRLIRHTGLAYGYTAFVGMVPELNLGFAILTNAGATTNPHFAIAREMIKLYKGDDGRNWREHYMNAFMTPRAPADESPKPDTIAPKSNYLYTGIYSKPDFGEVNIYEKEGTLYFRLRKADVPLKHKNGDIFTMMVPGAGTIQVEFFAGTNVPVESLTFDIGDPIGKFYKGPF